MSKTVDNESNKNTRKSGTNWDWVVFSSVIVLLIIIWFTSSSIINYFVVSPDPVKLSNEEVRGLFGDKFGAINSLFSCIAFVGIIFAIILQKRDLNQQRISIDAQSELTSIQTFETSFFNLLNQHKNNIDQLELSSQYKRAAFSYFKELLLVANENFSVFNSLKRLNRSEVITIKESSNIPENLMSKLELYERETISECITGGHIAIIGKYLDENIIQHQNYISESYIAAHKKSGDALSHYFRTLYVIYKYIDETPLIKNEKRKDYARIVRAQLSDDELLVLFYNVLAKPDSLVYNQEFGYPKMTKYVHKYDVLQNLNKARVFHPIHWTIFEDSISVGR